MWTPKHFCYFVLTCSIIGSASYSRSRKKKLTAKWNHSFSGLMSSKNCHNCPGLASLVCDWQRHQCWARCTERKADCWMFPVGSVVTLCLFKLKCSYTLHFLPSARKLTSHLGGWGFQRVPKPKGCNLSSVSCICCRAKTPPSLNAVSNNSTTGRLSWTTQGPMDKNNSPHLATVFIFASTTLKTVH